MTASFEKAVEIILENEGGYVNNPLDPGGETKYGISKRTYPNIDIKNLTKEGAKEIYYRDFWMPLKLTNLTDKNLSLHVFDMGVNAGKSRAVKILQKIVMVPEDGIMGNDTIAAANNSFKDLATLYSNARKEFYTNLAKSGSYSAFLKGWLNRVLSVDKKKKT